MLPLFLSLSLASISAQAQRAPLVIEHGTYHVSLLERRIGTEEYRITSSGLKRQLSAITDTSDRGSKRRITTSLDSLPNAIPIRFEQHSIAPANAIAAETDTLSLTETTGTSVTVREGEISRTFTRPALAFPGTANMPASAQMMMMRYWLHHQRPQHLNLLRAFADAPPVEIRQVGHDAFVVHGQTIRLTRYTVQNLIFGREILWMNDRERVAAVMTFAGGLPQEEILDEYSSAFDPLFQSGVSQEMLDLAALTRSVHPLASGSFAVVGAKLIDATGAPPVDNSVVLVRDKRIAAAGPVSTTPVPPDVQIIHAEGQSILPGLWDMHSHYSGVEFGPALLSAGITTARDCGGELMFLLAVRHAINEQQQLGPRLLFAGLVDGDSPDAFGLFTADTPAEATSVVDMYADAHFDQIKVYTQIKPEVLRAVSAEAHRRGLTVTGHVPAAVDAFQGVADGMDQINHLQFVTRSMISPGAGRPFEPADLASDRGRLLTDLLAQKQIVVEPTLAWGEMAGHPRSVATARFEPGVRNAPSTLAWRFNNMGVAGLDEANFRQRMAANVTAVGALFQAGVPIVAGSDTNLPGYGLDRELELYLQAGMTPMQAIQSATIVPARVMHHDSDSGTIEPGKRADLVLVTGDPLTRITDLRHVTRVVTNGRLYDSKALAETVGFRR